MKTFFKKHLLILFILICFPFLIPAQSNTELIKEIQALMIEHYIFLDKAKKVNAHLEMLLKKKYFDDFKTSKELTDAITEAMQDITQDKHLGVYPPRVPRQNSNSNGLPLRAFARYNTPMIHEVKYFENNVGYLDMRYFGGGEQNWEKIDAAMKQLQQADALIFDMRKNGGGSVRTVQYFCSYFFDTHLLLNSIYSRKDDHLEEHWTLDVKGQKISKVPVFILTSARTFSGAEDFSYTLQSHQRATIIGEVTGGGAHPTNGHTLSNQFRIFIPFARSIDPNTKTNWEGVGVQPDIKVSKEEALDKALILAAEAALKYKNSFIKPLEDALTKPKGQSVTQSEYEQVHQSLRQMVKLNMVNENDLNRFGYRFLSGGQAEAALTVFKINTQIFPNSANVFDSYAEALATEGMNDLALENYKKAVAIASTNKHPDLSNFKQNLREFEAKNE